eukprot:CAMPEP_0197657842 /NCGR_PEP_ID=MMETSP1338-20131121/44877_1 /TAXON_ID=43686 ORGANISM="Pelagodinium beii, Strain RCC1491" /NCGR_SAMPLE_ID=MMETSP1338 /ASSEMBLY_ACC=CAM_ASM_000754 /LENGTH=146 /DNA_ID=CAMNT_0043234303 /DNA_START=670 /DNA_END=1110 /DNA_ORIENTATION=-
MWPTACSIAEEEMHPHDRFAIIFGMTLSAIMGSLLSVFWAFHTWLMLKAWTTIEFCEKRSTGAVGISYDHGLYENIRAVLGPNPFLWLLPCSPPLGDGLVFQARGAQASLGESLLREKQQEEEPEKAVGVKEAMSPEVTGKKEAAA